MTDQSPLRKPEWLRTRLPSGEAWAETLRQRKRRGLATVCEEASCPNQCDCWGEGAVTFMILGDTCTRGCRFCNVKTAATPPSPDPDEPHRVAESVAELEARYVVLTSVDRDDLDDGGAGHFIRVIDAVKALGDVKVEALTPDFAGKAGARELLAESAADALGHNLETVERLTPRVRDKRASYRGSLDVLRDYKRLRPDRPTKSSLLLGLGETDDEIETAMRDLREADVDILTLGQYLQPTLRHLPVERYVTPEAFDEWAERGEAMGFACVMSGPLVRSSYRAEQAYAVCMLRQDQQD